jgi:hypothetical protein
MRGVFGDEAVQIGDVEIGALAFGHALQATFQRFPKCFDAAVFFGQALGHGLDATELIARLGAGDDGGKQLALLFLVMLKDGFAVERQRLLGDLPRAGCGLQQRGQLVERV